MKKEVEVSCPECRGAGFRVEPSHACLGEDKECAMNCPAPVQITCELCEGNCTLMVEV